MDKKEAISILKDNLPAPNIGERRIKLTEAMNLSIKSLEDEESQTISVQQLKHEIASTMVPLFLALKNSDMVGMSIHLDKIRQLSCD